VQSLNQIAGLYGMLDTQEDSRAKQAILMEFREEQGTAPYPQGLVAAITVEGVGVVDSKNSSSGWLQMTIVDDG
jgi:hypothetical protein